MKCKSQSSFMIFLTVIPLWQQVKKGKKSNEWTGNDFFKHFYLGHPWWKQRYPFYHYLWLRYYIYTARCTTKQLIVAYAMSFKSSFMEHLDNNFISDKNGDNMIVDKNWNI